MSHDEIEYLSRGGKSYAVAEAILNLALHDCERLVEATKRDLPRILADQLRKENEYFRKTFRQMSKIYLGIDPGSDGYLAVIDNGEYRFLPINDTPMLEIGKFVGEFRDTQCVAVLEDVHSVFGSSAQGTFNFGLSKGFLLGLLIAHRIPYVLVAPKDWQSAVWINADKEYTTQKQKLKNGGEKTVRKVDTKQTSYNAALRLFPDVDFRKSARCAKPHDGKVDALLMAEYGRRMNL